MLFAKILQNPVQQQHDLCIILPPISNCMPSTWQYQVSFTSLYTMTMLIVRSSIVLLTPTLECSYPLQSSHRFLTTWGAVMLEKTKKQTSLQGSSYQI